MKTFQLTPVNGRKSFGGKCRVEIDGNIAYLYSYNIKVAHYNMETNKMVLNGYHSATTSTHQNAFLQYYGFDVCTKKQIENYND